MTRRCIPTCCKYDDPEDGERELHILADQPAAMDHAADEALPRKDYESLNYDQCANVPYRRMIERLTDKTFVFQYLLRWIMVGAIGATTGFIAFLIDFIVRRLTDWKFNTVQSYLYHWAPEGNLVLVLVLLAGINAGFALIAAILTAIEPVAAGSGIPEIKCYLNGVKVPHVVRLRTLVSKAVGVLFSVAGGFFVGKEGPMIHTGAIVGSGLPQFRSVALRFINFDFKYFRSDRDKRDFVSSGAAAGVAAAFGAPIGGVLFSLEEGSSFWNQGLTWRTLFCSMVSTFTLNFFLSGTSSIGWGRLNNPSLIDFGEFECGSNLHCNLWTAVDLVIFIIIGAVGGLLGAAFNTFNTILTRYRMTQVQRKGKLIKIAEAILISLVTSTATFAAFITLGDCKSYVPATLPQDEELQNATRSFFCPNGTFNDMATLFFNPQEIAIKEFFHQKASFSLATLACYLVIFFILACWTYGAGIPSGLFVPCIACGASYGRLVAEILVKVGYLNEANVYLGTYSLIGAAAFLGGVVRMTISLTVILMESTNNISYGVPIMVSLMVAKWVGDLFNEGLYDIHIHLRAIPLLEWEAPEGTHRLSAFQVMSSNLHYIFPNTRVRSLVRMLRTTAHSAFPVVTKHKRSTQLRGLVSPPPTTGSPPAAARPQEDSYSTSVESAKVQLRSRVNQTSPEYMALCRAHAMQHAPDLLSIQTSRLTFSMSHASLGSLNGNHTSFPVHSGAIHTDGQDHETVLLFHGMVLRHHLVKILKERLFVSEDDDADRLPVLEYEKLLEDYPRFPDIHDVHIAQEDMGKIVDVTPYMTPCPYTVSTLSPIPYVFNLFRTMGLRHLPVLDSMGQLAGIITRHNLTHPFLERIMNAHGLSH